MDFEIAYEKFIRYHVRHRSGPGADRIKSGLGHAEKLFLEQVWWPTFETFDGLHPEYEVQDYKEGYRFIDFAYVASHFRIAIEIDGVGTHWKNITTWQFSDHCNRQNHLQIDGWHLLRFAYQDVKTQPRMCQQTVQQMIGRLTGSSDTRLSVLQVIDRAIIRLALVTNRPITPTDVVTHVKITRNTAIYHLRTLTSMGWLEPASGASRIRSYRVAPSRTNIQL